MAFFPSEFPGARPPHPPEPMPEPMMPLPRRPDLTPITPAPMAPDNGSFPSSPGGALMQMLFDSFQRRGQNTPPPAAPGSPPIPRPQSSDTAFPLWAVRGLLKSPYAKFAGWDQQPFGGNTMDAGLPGMGDEASRINGFNMPPAWATNQNIPRRPY